MKEPSPQKLEDSSSTHYTSFSPTLYAAYMLTQGMNFCCLCSAVPSVSWLTQLGFSGLLLMQCLGLQPEGQDDWIGSATNGMFSSEVKA